MAASFSRTLKFSWLIHSPTRFYSAMASNAPVAKQGPLDFMEKLSDVVSFYRPAADQPDPSSPKLIAVFSWMAAQDLHIAKYITQHQAMHPTSPILLVKCPFSHTMLSSRAKREMQPVLPVISSIFPAAEERKKEKSKDCRPEMLLHVFSNGGCFNMHQLINLFVEKALVFPLHVALLDSCPGQFHWGGSYRALSASFPGALKPLVHVLLAVLVLAYKVTGTTAYPQETMAAAINSEVICGRELRRTYAFSSGDRLIEVDDVVAHGEEARGEGLDVRLENFGKSGHVAHMRSDPDRYWGLMKELWEGK